MNGAIEKYRAIKKARPKKSGMGGRIFGAIFGLFFLAPGLLIMGWGGYDLSEWIKIQSWQPVPGYIIDIDLKTSSGSEGGTTYKTTASYTYRYNGREYNGDRATLYDGSFDNIGSFQEDAARKLRRQRDGKTDVYINPDDPSDSILMRDFRWGFFIFKFIFGLIFAAVGAVVVYASLAKKNEKSSESTVNQQNNQPWFDNKKWQTPEILSDAKLSMWGMTGFTIVWNAITLPTVILAFPEIQKEENYWGLLVLLFPLAGLFIAYKAAQMWLEYRRFGLTPFTMDPFPGGIGGQVGGTIDIKARLKHDTQYKINLANIYSYVTGSGDDKSRRENILWEKTVIAHAEPYLDGTRLSFTIDVPADGVRPSDALRNHEDYDLWRVNVTCDIDGVDLDRNFEIPVYATGEKSRNISHRIIEDMKSGDDEYNDKMVDQHLPLRQSMQGYELYYPYFRNIKSGIGGLVFGAIFAGVAIFTFYESDVPYVFTTVFGLVGGLIILFSIYSMTNSLHVYSDGVYLYSRRKILGVPFGRRAMLLNDIRDLKIANSSTYNAGKKQLSYYQIRALDGGRKKMTIAEGLPGRNVAERAVEEIKGTFNISIDSEA